VKFNIDICWSWAAVTAPLPPRPTATTSFLTLSPNRLTTTPRPKWSNRDPFSGKCKVPQEQRGLARCCRYQKPCGQCTQLCDPPATLNTRTQPTANPQALCFTLCRSGLRKRNKLRCDLISISSFQRRKTVSCVLLLFFLEHYR
jgi:hypothetical protein